MSRALLVDLYELTMSASYLAEGLDRPATYELFFRDLPPVRNYLVVGGLERALDALEGLQFADDDLDYLRGLGLFNEAFLARLGGLRFTGDVWAVPEGEVVFANEPVVRVTAPLIEGQLLETALLNCYTLATAVASKASRVATACAGRPFADFSARRDHGPDAALYAARAAFIAGASSTSNVEAGQRFGIPLSGTMAHSYVLAFPSELDAFRAFTRQFPDASTLLVDTYDVLEGTRRAAEVAGELAASGGSLGGVRLDSGDLGALSVQVRSILDAAGLPGVKIVASGDLDEYRIAALLAAGAPIDAFGVGTQLGTSGDAPSLGAVYKLVEDVTGPKAKTSTGKATRPGVKQVYRFGGVGGMLERDLIAPAAESAPDGGRPLLEPVMAGGRRRAPSPPLAAVRERYGAAVAALPARVRSLGPAAPYPVEVSGALGLGLGLGLGGPA
ncbi:MAG TPA: nicotinate phosphoribosyltransferase [Actinomycetota bacterium]|nr:nicotinate phosphoribosyltransferase [Actinomycetota bacterium]